jgi:hypothetical protein
MIFSTLLPYRIVTEIYELSEIMTFLGFCQLHPFEPSSLSHPRRKCKPHVAAGSALKALSFRRKRMAEGSVPPFSPERPIDTERCFP